MYRNYDKRQSGHLKQIYFLLLSVIAPDYNCLKGIPDNIYLCPLLSVGGLIVCETL